MMPTLFDSLHRESDKAAIIVPSQSGTFVRSYSGLFTDVASLQRQFAELGLKQSEAVSIILPNNYGFVVSFLAATFQRLYAAPLNAAYKEDEFDFYFRDLLPAMIIVPERALENNLPAVRVAQRYGIAIAECYSDGENLMFQMKEFGKIANRAPGSVSSPQPDDIALVLHTSGTTGRPKVVPLTHRNMVRTMQNIQTTYDLNDADRSMLVMPLFHIHGLLAGLFAPLFSGGSVVIPPGFSAKSFWQDFVKNEANWYTAVPTIHQILLRNPCPNPMPTIRFIRSSSAPLSPATFRALEETFGAPVLESYGMTEACHQMTSNPLPSKGSRRPGSVGLPVGIEIKILDESGREVAFGINAEICIRGENVTTGYLNNPAANSASFTEEGFFRTGDQGRMDKDGYVTLSGRIKELINRAGEKISPAELDQVALSCPDIAEACSFGIPSDLYGEEIGMAIVAKSGDGVTETSVKEYLQNKVVKFKVPHQVWIVSHLPKTPTGKIQRGAISTAVLSGILTTVSS